MIVGAPLEVRTSPTPLPLVFVVVVVVIVVGHRREETFSAPAAVAAETCRIIQVGKCDKQVSIRALFAIDGRGRGENIGAGEENNATKG